MKVVVMGLGIFLAIVGIAILGYMAVQIRKSASLDDIERNNVMRRMVGVNFAGLALGVFGLILVTISFVID